MLDSFDWVEPNTEYQDELLAGYFGAIAAEMANDAGRDLYDAGGMDEKTIRRAAAVTLRRAICVRFPPGQERRRWLRRVAANQGDFGRRPGSQSQEMRITC
jgi:hypothetical protein